MRSWCLIHHELWLSSRSRNIFLSLIFQSVCFKPLLGGLFTSLQLPCIFCDLLAKVFFFLWGLNSYNWHTQITLALTTIITIIEHPANSPFKACTLSVFSASFADFHVAVEQQLVEVNQYENCTNFYGYLVTQVDSSVCYSRMMVCWRQMDWHASGGYRLGIFDVIKESQKSSCLWSCLYW